MKSRWMLAAAAALAVTALTGCANGAPWVPRVLEPATVVTPEPGENPCRVEGAVAGRIPDDFEPVGVYVCEIEMQVGEPTQLGEEPIYPAPPPMLAGDLEPLVAALAEPSDPISLGPCPAIGFAGPGLRLVDAAGRVVAAAYPAEACGLPKGDALDRVDAALATLLAATPHPQPSAGS